MQQLATELRAIADELESLSRWPPESAEKRVTQLAQAVRAAAERLPDEEPQSPDGNAEADPGARILVVDDDPVAQEILKACLSPYGSIELFATGEDVISDIRATVTNNPPDLVVLDIRLPGISGHEVLERIRALKAIHNGRFQPHVLMTSSLDSKEHVVSSLRMGASGYLVKPVNPLSLARQMSAIGFEPVLSSA